MAFSILTNCATDQTASQTVRNLDYLSIVALLGVSIAARYFSMGISSTGSALMIGVALVDFGLLIQCTKNTQTQKTSASSPNYQYTGSEHSYPELEKAIVESIPSKLVPRDKARTYIEAVALGQALGDACGVHTEFLTKEEAAESIGKQFDFTDVAVYREKNPHAKKFHPNAWTDDTDQFFALLRGLYRAKKLNDLDRSHLHVAFQLKTWLYKGLSNDQSFPGTHDPACRGLGNLVGQVLSQGDYLEHPIVAARRVWWNSNPEMSKRLAANGAIMRCSVIPLVFMNDPVTMIRETIKLAKITHADPRCIASCVALNTAIAFLLKEGNPINAELEALKMGARFLGAECARYGIELDPMFEEFRKHIRTRDLSTLKLDDKLRGYTYKCLGVCFWALNEAQMSFSLKKDPEVIFKEIIHKIMLEGGDADTNCAPAAALVTAYFYGHGKQCIPSTWALELANSRVLSEHNRIMHELFYPESPQ